MPTKKRFSGERTFYSALKLLFIFDFFQFRRELVLSRSRVDKRTPICHLI